MNNILQYARIEIPNSYLFISLAIMFTIIIANKYICRDEKNKRKYNCEIISLEYLYLILCATVFCRPTTGVHEFCVIPFRNYITFFTTTKSYLPWEILEEIFMNVMLFIPIGILVAIYDMEGSANIKKPLVVGLLISCSIEILQLLLCRGCCETNDILHNTIGCILGYGLYLMLQYLWKTKIAYGR